MGFLRLIGAHLILITLLLFGWMIPSDSVWENIQRFIAGFIAGLIVVAFFAMLFVVGYWIFN